MGCGVLDVGVRGVEGAQRLSSGTRKGMDGRNAGEVMVATTESRQGPWPRRVNPNSCDPAALGDVGKRGLSTIGPTARKPKGRCDPGPWGS